MKVLPDKKSELLRLAVRNLEEVESMPDVYKVNMDAWHYPRLDFDDKCHVCVAGSVIARTLGAKPDQVRLPYHFDPDDAIDLRELNWDRLKIEDQGIVYSENPDRFKAALLELAAHAESHGN